MLKELNEYLADHVSVERRALVVDSLRTLESLLGASIYESLDPLLQIEEAAEPASTLDVINETILGLFYQAYSQFGITLDKAQLEPDQFYELNTGIEALLQIEVSELGEELTVAMECSDDTVDALLNVLETIIPESSAKLANLIENVSTNLIARIRDTINNPVVVSEFDDETNKTYLARIRAYNERRTRPELVEFLLDAGANLRLNPANTMALVADHFTEFDIRDVAETIYALVVYSSVPDSEVITTTKALCDHAFADEEKIAKLELIINDVFRS